MIDNPTASLLDLILCYRIDRLLAIQFVDLLSAETPGVDGHVFETIIESKHYTLKMARDTPIEASVETQKLIHKSPCGSLLSSIIQLKPMV